MLSLEWIGWHITEFIDCYEKIVRIPLPNGNVLVVHELMKAERIFVHLHVSRLMRKSLMTYVLSETSLRRITVVRISIPDTKQKVTSIKDVEDLQVRIEKLEEIFSYLRNRKLKQKEVILGTDDETSSNDDTSSNDEISSSEDLINYLSARDVEWQLPKNTQEEPPKPHYAPIKTEVEEPLPLDIVYPHSHVASSVMGTNRTGKAHYGLRSLGPLKEEMVHVKKPYNMVKVTNVVLGLKASNS
ncbi:hypothetical protein Tco_1466253 [Tanacetum coccineum]